jgi:hypothetical protein
MARCCRIRHAHIIEDKVVTPWEKDIQELSLNFKSIKKPICLFLISRFTHLHIRRISNIDKDKLSP